MELSGQYHAYAATFLARLFLGCLFFFQGYDAVMKVGAKNVSRAYEYDFASKGIPKFITVCAAWFTSYTELLGGLLLILGLFEYPALYLLAVNLLVAAIGFGIHTAMWDTRHVFPRLVLIIFLLTVPPHWHAWTLDHFIFKP